VEVRSPARDRPGPPHPVSSIPVEPFLAHFGYAAVFAALLVAGVGVPIPEELTQLTAGALSHEGYLSLRYTIPVVWAGILAGDAILFLLARRHGPRALASRPARRVLTPERRARLERHFARHAFLTVAVARHTGGLRFAAFALAGATGVPLPTFLAADGLSALASVPLVVGAGYLFAHHLGAARRDVRLAELGILAAIVLAGLVAVNLRRRRARASAGGGGPAGGAGRDDGDAPRDGPR
jgi:membrane-associated protein